ncbi:MAG: DMT family transporter [Patescibacteria group bacterium]
MTAAEFFKKPSVTGITAGIVARFTSRTDIVFGKILLNYISPMFLAFLETFTAMIMMFFYMGIKQIIIRLRELEKSELSALTICSILSGVIGPLFFLQGLNQTSGINTSIIVNLNPVFMSIFAVMILREEFTKNLLIGMLTLFTAMVFLGTEGFTKSIHFRIGDIYLIISAIGYSFGNILFKKYIHSRHLDVLVAYRTIVSSLIFGGIMWFFMREDLNNFVSHFQNYYQWILFYALIGIIVTYALQYWALENTSLINNALIAVSSPIIGIVYSNIFLKEQITLVHLGTIVLVVIGLIITKIDLIEKTLFDMKMRLRQTHNG